MLFDFFGLNFSSIPHAVRQLRLTYLANAENLSEEPKKSLLTRPSDDISQTDPYDWKYVAEGGSTIVFSYDGPRSLRFDGMVLRLRKSPRRSGCDLKASKEEEDLNVQVADDPTVDFQERVISRLVPAEFLPHLDHIEVERAWLEKMIVAHDEKRPEKRRVKDGIHLNRARAVLATNLIGSKGWAMEIKVWSINALPLRSDS